MRCRQSQSSNGNAALASIETRRRDVLLHVLRFVLLLMSMFLAFEMAFGASANGSDMGKSTSQPGRPKWSRLSNVLTRQLARSVAVAGSRRPIAIGDSSAGASETNTASFETSRLSLNRACRLTAALSAERCNTVRQPHRPTKRSYGEWTPTAINNWKSGASCTHSTVALTASGTRRRAGNRWGCYPIRARRAPVAASVSAVGSGG